MIGRDEPRKRLWAGWLGRGKRFRILGAIDREPPPQTDKLSTLMVWTAGSCWDLFALGLRCFCDDTLT